jgi:hypothetical protein
MSDIRGGILKALQEERKPSWRPALMGFLVFAAAFLFFHFFLRSFWAEPPGSFVWISLLWSIGIGLGVALYQRPQTRIEVRGFWSPLILGKVLIVGVLSMCLQLVLCPHFAFLSGQLPGLDFFEHVVAFYSRVGGERGCLVLCGISFGIFSAAFALFWVRKSLCFEHLKPIVFASAALLFVTLPVSLWLFENEHHEASPLFWVLGLAIGIFLSALLAYVLANHRRIKTAIPADLADFDLLYRRERSALRDKASAQGTSPFFDKAESHIYSDWLIPCVLQTGWDYGDEYYLAGFPDLSEVLDRSAQEPQLHQDVWKGYRKSGMSSFGRLLHRHLRGKLLIDLGSGRPGVSVAPRLIAEELKAAAYVGVDLALSESFMRKAEFNLWPDAMSFKSFFIRADVGEFVASLRPSAAYAVHIAGMELINPQSADSRLSVQGLMQSLQKALLPGGCLVLGAASHDFKPKEEDFKFIGQDRYHRLFLRR